MARVRQTNTTILGFTAEFKIENTKMLPRFLKEFKHPTHMRIRTSEHLKCVVLADVLSYHFNKNLMEEYDGFMDLSELYPDHEDSSYSLDTYLVEALDAQTFKIDMPLLGEVRITKLKIELPI